MLKAKVGIVGKGSLAGDLADMGAGVALVRQELAGLQDPCLKVWEISDVIGVKILLMDHDRYKTASVGIFRSCSHFLQNVVKGI